MAEGRHLRPAQRPAATPGARGRRAGCRAERLRAVRVEHQDLRQRAGGRPEHRRRQENAGRKRHIGVDTLGLLLAAWVTTASVSDNTGGIRLLTQISAATPRVARPGPTPATARKPSTTAPASESTSKSSNATPASKGSR
ncbi:transposase [Streptomyces sp. NPDC048281]|uniref:transposase n=1 Tax=Streptomyces sp. NPDC048281 TaxID=3154715 RepID=UPI0034168046